MDAATANQLFEMYGRRIEYTYAKIRERPMSVFDYGEPNRFFKDLTWKILVEWSSSDGKGKETSYYQDNEREEIVEFVERETHYLLVNNMGYSWDDESRKFRNFNPKDYERATEIVLDALVLAGLDLHKTGDFYKGEKFSLRQNLSPFIEKIG